MANNNSTIKLACPRTLAKLPLSGKVNPVGTTRMLEMVEVHDFLYHSGWMEGAKLFVAKNPNTTLRELQAHIVALSKDDPDTTEWYGTYVWGYDRVSSVKRALHEDAEGHKFIKHEYKWKIVFPIDRFGSLIGTSHNLDPLLGFFCPSLSRVGKDHTI